MTRSQGESPTNDPASWGRLLAAQIELEAEAEKRGDAEGVAYWRNLARISKEKLAALQTEDQPK